MHYWVCVDDTDMPGTKGTGWLVQNICREMEKEGIGTCSPVSRHQLFVHDDIPFTSHNSAMSFEIDLINGYGEAQLIRRMINALETRSARGSDPGLCVAGEIPEEARQRLTTFGRTAKRQICTKPQAYALARELGIHLSEHGGTGDGIIGAVAGIGLRLSGDDGRYRGWYHLGNPGDVVMTSTLRAYPFIDRLVTEHGRPVPEGQPVAIGSEKTKTVRLGFQRTLVVKENETLAETGVRFRTITKEEAKHY
ncbi:MAG: hypothetical protein MI802_25385 [Desulfobacterales bacterium]|nr:hypothetical protein [Desulfobacterales bacterium]